MNYNCVCRAARSFNKSETTFQITFLQIKCFVLFQLLEVSISQFVSCETVPSCDTPVCCLQSATANTSCRLVLRSGAAVCSSHKFLLRENEIFLIDFFFFSQMETIHLLTNAERSTNKEKFAKKTTTKKLFLRGILHPFWAKVFKSETTSFHYFSSRIRKSKQFGH